MRKPSWMSRDDWSEFNRINPAFCCRSCGETDLSLATVDHVVPKWQGGTDDLSNLQWLCCYCNSRKGPRDDPFWAQNFYWDREINLSAARTAQRMEAYERVLYYKDWFTRPFSQISRILYTLSWIVGSGKTLAIPILAFAVNHVIRRELGEAHPRINKMLILSKEQAIRNQLAEDIKNEIVSYGLCGAPPRVLVLTDGATLKSPQVFDQYDIVVSCVHMFYEKNGQPMKGLEETLSYFQMIAVDEPHYAADQVIRIVQSAATSICFGFTGSPIDATGIQLESFVQFSIYDYQSACDNDQSLKLLVPPDQEKWSEIYEEVDITQAEIHRSGEKSTIKNTDMDGYPLNAHPAITVAASVVRYVHDCDTFFAGDPLLDLPYRPAMHRPEDVRADLIYPMHAMIALDTIEMGQMVCQWLNDLFNGDRHKYPKSLGYQADVVHSETSDQDGVAKRGKKLTVDHPWMDAKRNRGRVTSTSVRFIVVIGMLREGVNNPPCGVVGVACQSQSMINNVQRVIGRQLRAVVEWLKGRLSVPPDMLDTIKIISHSAYKNRPFIEAAARFVLNMSDSLDGMQTMEDLIRGESDSDVAAGINPNAFLTRREKIAIVAAVGDQRLNGASKIDVDSIVDAFGGDSPAKRERVRSLTTTTANDPQAARRHLNLSTDITEIPRVMREYPAITPSDEVLVRFIKRHTPNLLKYCVDLDAPAYREIFSEMYRIHVAKFHHRDLPVSTKLSVIKSQIARAVKEQLEDYYEGPESKVYSLCYTAMGKILGIRAGEKLDDVGRYDTPECHVILGGHDARNDMIGWVTRCLIGKGYCPRLASGLVIPLDGEGTSDGDKA